MKEFKVYQFMIRIYLKMLRLLEMEYQSVLLYIAKIAMSGFYKVYKLNLRK